MPLDPFYYNGTGNAATRLLAQYRKASNLPSGSNPTYASADFLSFFPQFNTVCTVVSPATTSTVPQALLTNFIARANASLAFDRYQDNWVYCMGLYIAHNITLFLRASASTTSPGIVSNAQPILLATSKSVDSVSVGYDVSSVMQDTEGWGMWKTTSYGLQLIAYAKIAGMGGMLV